MLLDRVAALLMALETRMCEKLDSLEGLHGRIDKKLALLVDAPDTAQKGPEPSTAAFDLEQHPVGLSPFLLGDNFAGDAGARKGVEPSESAVRDEVAEPQTLETEEGSSEMPAPMPEPETTSCPVVFLGERGKDPPRTLLLGDNNDADGSMDERRTLARLWRGSVGHPSVGLDLKREPELLLALEEEDEHTSEEVDLDEESTSERSFGFDWRREIQQHPRRNKSVDCGVIGKRDSRTSTRAEMVRESVRHSVLATVSSVRASARKGFPVKKALSFWDEEKTTEQKKRQTVSGRQTPSAGKGHRLAQSMSQEQVFVEDILSNQSDDTEHRCNPSGLLSTLSFELLVQGMILANTASMTVGVAQSLQGHPEHWVLTLLEAFFCIFFTVELALRFTQPQHRWKFFHGRDCRWNIMDTILVVCTWVDLLLSLFDSWTGNWAFVRLLRQMRMMRLSRFTRAVLLSHPQCKLALDLLANSVQAVAPALFVAFVVSYMFMLAILELQVRDLVGETDPDRRQVFLRDWGTPAEALLSMYKAVSGGVAWNDAAVGLRNPFSYGLFVLFVAFFQFIVMNVTICNFVHSTLRLVHSGTNLDRNTLLQRKDDYIRRLHEIFGTFVDSVNFEDFADSLDDRRMQELFSKWGVNLSDAEQFVYSLSRQGTVPVGFDELTVGCIKMMDPATKVDLLKLTDTVDDAIAQASPLEPTLGFNRTSTLTTAGSQAELEITPVLRDEFVRKLTNMHLLTMMQTDKDRTDFSETVQALVKVVLQCEGGCGFVVASHAALTSIGRQKVDFQVTDKSALYKDGYMTERLQGVHVSDETFLQAISAFSAHSDTDQWPHGHEASGLPKDGYTLLNLRGFRLKCAARICGLPLPPYSWEGVGTRHTTALAVCWALRLFPAIVIVRSDRGTVHGLYFMKGSIVALECVSSLHDATGDHHHHYRPPRVSRFNK